MNLKSILDRVYQGVLSFFDDDTTYYAASLSFFTIFSLLPILAIFIVAGSYLDFFDKYIQQLMTYIFEVLNPTHSQSLIDIIQNFLSNTDKLGDIGLIYILFVFTMFINDYEYIVNKIHQTKKRSLFRIFFIYLATLIFLPLLFAISKIILSLYSSDMFQVIISFTLGWLIFAIIFKVSINKKLTYKSVFISSFLTLAILNITKNLFIFYVFYNKTYTTIYGSFSTLLFFFLWLYISWIIYLYGIKICHELHIKYTSTS